MNLGESNIGDEKQKDLEKEKYLERDEVRIIK